MLQFFKLPLPESFRQIVCKLVKHVQGEQPRASKRLIIYHSRVPARGGAEVALQLYYKTFLIYRTCMCHAPARPVRVCFVRSCCGVVVQEHDLPATRAQCNQKRTLSSHFTLHSSHPAPHFTLHTCTSPKLAQSTSQYYVVLQSLHTGHPTTTLYHKACTKHVPGLLCAAKLAQSRSEYYFALHSFVLQSLHKVRPRNTLCYKACTKYVPVLLCTANKACTRHVPVLLCTTKLAQSKSHYYTKCFPAPHPCSHYNAICNHGFQNTLALCTHNEPSIAKHHQGTNHTPKRTDRTCGAHEVPFIAGRSHFTQKNAGFHAPASSPPFMNVLVCDVKSQTALHECIVMWCKVSHGPSCECIDMWCTVSHGPSWMYCYVM